MASEEMSFEDVDARRMDRQTLRWANNRPMTKNEPTYYIQNEWKGEVVQSPFICLLIFKVINWFIFGHGVVIYYIWIQFCTCNTVKKKGQTNRNHATMLCNCPKIWMLFYQLVMVMGQKNADRIINSVDPHQTVL